MTDLEGYNYARRKVKMITPATRQGCKGLCETIHMTTCDTRGSLSRGYNKCRMLLDGWKRCTKCEKMIMSTDSYCNCCGRLLSTRPSSSKSNKRLNKLRNIHRY